MVTALDLVVTCTDRKAARPQVRVADLPRRLYGAPDVDAWLTQISRTPRTHAARHLYQGETWAASLELEATAGALRGTDKVRMWIASAGYGVVAADEPLCPYSATFSANSKDYVGGHGRGTAATDDCRAWWHALTARSEETSGRSIASVAAGAQGDVLVVLSEAYLRSCQGDVVQAVAANDRTIVVSPSAHRSIRIGHAAPRFDARLLTTAVDRRKGHSRPITRGTRMSLNVRTARLLVEHFGARPMERRDASAFLEELTTRQSPLEVFPGEQHDDQAVRAFIQGRLTEHGPASKTQLLRAFRDAGNKCEQKRFGTLFEEVRTEASARRLPDGG
jgi:hypothetical protein